MSATGEKPLDDQRPPPLPRKRVDPVGRRGLGIMDKTLQEKAIDAERRIRSGELHVYSAEESRRWMAEFAKKVADQRKKLVPK